MSVSVRPYRSGGWLVDVRVRLADGSRYRDRKRITASKSAAAALGPGARSGICWQFGLPAPKKEVPTLKEFAPRFMEGHVRANRTETERHRREEMLLRVHLLPFFGHKRLDGITNEDVAAVLFKASMIMKAPKTVKQRPQRCSARSSKKPPSGTSLMPFPADSDASVPPQPVGFTISLSTNACLMPRGWSDTQTHLIVLLGGDAGLAVRRNDCP